MRDPWLTEAHEAQYIPLGVVNFDTWYKYARVKNFSPVVLSYLKVQPDMLYNDNLKANGITLNPMRWERINHMLQAGLPKEVWPLLFGTGRFCQQFIAWVENAEQTPKLDVELVLSGSQPPFSKKDRVEQYLVVSTLLHGIRIRYLGEEPTPAIRQSLDNAIRFVMDSCDPEYVMVFIREVSTIDGMSLSRNMPAFREFATEHWERLQTGL